MGIATLAVVALLFHRFDALSWTEPNWLVGDPVEVYLRVKIASEQPVHALFRFDEIARLGAPFAADWSAYPVPDRLIFVLTGQLARAIGLIAAVQLMAALILGLNAASFYLCARWLRCRWEWAAGLAICFAVCSYNLRWAITLSLSQVFVLPPLILLLAWAARRRIPPRSTHRWKGLALVCAVWLGVSNPYLAFFAGVVGTGGLLLALIRRAPRMRVLPVALFLIVLTVTFVGSNAAYLLPRWQGETGAALVRGAGDFAAYALHPLEWFVPPADHRAPWLGRIGHAYLAARGGLGEFFYNYLGLVGIVGLILLISRSLHRPRPLASNRHDPLWGLVGITLFAMPRGVNVFLQEAGLDVFRAGTRIGISAELWLLLFLVGFLSRSTRRWWRPASVLGAVMVSALAIWEATPPLGAREAPRENRARWDAYADLTRHLEVSLPAGAPIFQLPVVPFPEAGRTFAMPDYEHALPFLTSTTLRFSYGELRPSPALAWARYVSRQPVASLIAALEEAGFAALWIDTRGYADGGQQLLEDLARVSLTPEPTPVRAPYLRIVRLQPSRTPALPNLGDPRLKEPWDERLTSGSPALLALQGWFPSEYANGRHWRWAGESARLGIWHEGPSARATLRLHLAGPAQNRVVLRITGQPDRVLVPQTAPQNVSVELAPGLTVLDFILEGRTFRPGGGDPRELGFMIENLAVSVP